MAKHRNILANTYVPVLGRKTLKAVLGRLSKPSILALVQLWPQLKNTQPPKPTHTSQAAHNRHVRDQAKAMATWTKAKIVDAVIHELWPTGLNLLQLAQIDCQLLVDSQNAYLWVLSTVLDAFGNKAPLLLDPKAFLNRLAQSLSLSFLSHIYVCTHPNMPSVLVRIQVFDLLPISRPRSRPTALAQPHIVSHKPYFLAIPMSSPNLVHLPDSDLVSEVVLQAVEASLARHPGQVLHLSQDDARPKKSLLSMHILKGSSRFANSLGPWAPYADTSVDISPLAPLAKHPSVVAITSKAQDCTTPQEKTERLANTRFKGSPEGTLQSTVLYDTLPGQKRRKHAPEKASKRPRNTFASVVPITHATYEIRQLHPGTNLHSKVKITFRGSDVFAGLHELSLDEQSPVNLHTLPGWLTGEEGESCGTVTDGEFRKQ